MGDTCTHLSDQPAGLCQKPKSCSTDRDCSTRQTCVNVTGNTGECRFRYVCDLPKECNNGDTRECSTGKPGRCATGIETCQSGRWSTCVSTNAQKEVCNGKDDNCDGKVDNGLVCVITVAGSTGKGDYIDGDKETARFYSPRGVAVDSSGNIYVTDTLNHCIRKIDKDGNVTTFAGNGQPGTQDGQGKAARFNGPIGLVLDRQDNLYVADSDNHRIRKITPSQEVITIAGERQGSTDGKGSRAGFNRPMGLAIDTRNNLYVADSGNHQIRKVTPDGEVTTIAGDGQVGYRDGKAEQAQFNSPRGLVWATDGSLYISDTESHLIRWLDAFGEVRTMAGSFQQNDWVDDTGSRARFNSPGAIIIEPSGFLLVADVDNHNIRRINLQGRVVTLAGRGNSGFKNGDALRAQFRFPWSIIRDTKGRLIVADTDNNSIRMIVTHPK